MRWFASIAPFVVLLAVPGAAQQEAGTLAQEYWMKVKPGMGAEFEKGYRAHNEWHRNNDAWPWETWQILVGENVGSYVIRTGGHDWADFDANAQTLADGGNDFANNVIGSVESINSRVVNFLPEASSWPQGMERPPLVITHLMWPMPARCPRSRSRILSNNRLVHSSGEKGVFPLTRTAALSQPKTASALAYRS